MNETSSDPKSLCITDFGVSWPDAPCLWFGPGGFLFKPGLVKDYWYA